MVKCGDCGFLALRNSYTGALDEADEGFRESGTASRIRRDLSVVPTDSYIEPFLYPYQGAPLCFARAINLARELSRLNRPVLDIISQERDCLSFTPWEHGFTPKEHREMLERHEAQENEKRRDLAIQRREDARDITAKEWHAEQEVTAEKQHKEQMEELRSQHRTEVMIFGFFIGAATLLAAVIEGGISRGWDWWPFF